jgi:hypothetical protein
MGCPKNTADETIWSPDCNSAAIVEYAAIPEAKQNQP